MRFAVAAFALGLVAMTAPAQADSRAERGEARLAKALEGRVAGKPVRCIDQRNILSSQIIDRTAIIYRGPGNVLYVNRPNGREALDSNAILVTDSFNGQLCSIDTVRLVDRSPGGMMRGVLGLNEFAPYAKPKK